MLAAYARRIPWIVSSMNVKSRTCSPPYRVMSSPRSAFRMNFGITRSGRSLSLPYTFEKRKMTDLIGRERDVSAPEMGRIGIEVCVKQGDFIAFIDELLRRMAADEAIASGDEHAVHPSPSAVSNAESRRDVIRFRLFLFAASFPSAVGARKSSMALAYSDVLTTQHKFRFLSKLKTSR